MQIPDVDPEQSYPMSIESRLSFLNDPKAESFVKECLKVDPEKRPSCEDLMNHPYFDDFRDWFEDEIQTLIEFDSMDQF